MGLLRLSGSLDAGPPPVTTESFPASSFSVPLAFLETSKAFNVASGVLSRRLSTLSPSYAVLDGLGTSSAVTKATFLYLKSSSSVVLRLTTDDGSGGSVMTLLPVLGLVLLEFNSLLFLKQLEAQGSAQLEYFVSGLE